MKTRKLLDELRGTSESDLRAKARTLADELMRLRFRKRSGQLEQSHRIGEIRRTLARTKTLIGQMRKGQVQVAKPVEKKAAPKKPAKTKAATKAKKKGK